MKQSSVLLLLFPMLVWCEETFLPADCSDIYNHKKDQPSGVYTIYPVKSLPRSAVEVYCDMNSEGGRWTVFQRRMDGSLNFYRGWDQYKIGFGDAAGEYWLGLENIYQLTRSKKYELLVNLEDFDGNKTFGRYSEFKVDSECDGYKLTVSGYQGTAGDSLVAHNGMKFSTFDKDQDNWPNNCAKSFLGAFWYNACHATNPNGVYIWGQDSTIFAIGVEWREWKGHNYSLKKISMQIRPVQ